MEKEKYIVRLAEHRLEELLHSSGCVLVSGPKFCGKTTLCQRYAKSSYSLKTINQIKYAESDPSSILVGETPRLIDEWQKVPLLWDIIKGDLDDNYDFGKYMLTGSTTPVNPHVIQHNGAGRIAKLVLKPFSLYESNESNGWISLSKLFSQEKNAFSPHFPNPTDPNLLDIAFYICRGGWPIAVLTDKKYSISVTRQYYNGLFDTTSMSDDFAQLLKGKDVATLTLVLKSFARNISTEAKSASMIKDILKSGVRDSLDYNTFISYEKLLKDLFIIYDIPAKNFNLRTSIEVRTSPTHHFIDTSIATACLGIKPNDLINDLNSFGYFFEDFAIRDLSIYSDFIDGELKHYRDSAGQEVDAIIEVPNGTYCAIEIKIYSPENINKGLASLKSFESRLINSNQPTPCFKMIVTSHGPCYKQDDVYIVPITYLKP